MNKKETELIARLQTFNYSAVGGGTTGDTPTVAFIASEIPLTETIRFRNAERLLEIARNQVVLEWD